MRVGIDEACGQYRSRHLEQGGARFGLPGDLAGGPYGAYDAIRP